MSKLKIKYSNKNSENFNLYENKVSSLHLNNFIKNWNSDVCSLTHDKMFKGINV